MPISQKQELSRLHLLSVFGDGRCYHRSKIRSAHAFIPNEQESNQTQQRYPSVIPDA